MKILAISDVEIGFIYSPLVREKFQDVDIVISCGDLPYYYLEYIVSTLNVPLYFVRGNHASVTEFGTDDSRKFPWGTIDLHQKVIEDETGLLIAGLEGCLRYNRGPFQYSQIQYWNMVFKLIPKLLVNKLRFGRYLDIFVTHAPPWGIHDMEDLPHRGIKAFSWLIKVFKPIYHLHGHIHIYRRDTITQTMRFETLVTNAYGYREIFVELPALRSWQKSI
jgi:Icc-related predicted phosphoesterase